MEFTVSKLNKNLKSLINLQFPNQLTVIGEISNLKGSHGHAYLSLKDSSSLISAVMWKSVFCKYKNLKNYDKVNSGKMTSENASKYIGQKYYDQYVKGKVEDKVEEVVNEQEPQTKPKKKFDLEYV